MPVMVRWSWLARGLSAVLLAAGDSGAFPRHQCELRCAFRLCSGGRHRRRHQGAKAISRVEPETVRTYLTFNVGDPYDLARVDESLKALFATGLFQDVRIRREGSTVVVIVVENPIVSRVAFEGNSEVDDDALSREVQLKPRSVYTRARVQADVQRILDLYRRQGLYAAQVNPKIINLDNNRIDVVFEINEGPTTKVRAINFIGNDRLQRFAAPLCDHHHADQHPELPQEAPTSTIPTGSISTASCCASSIMKNGYADARIISATADLDRDGRGFFITFTIEEGPRIQVRR